MDESDHLRHRCPLELILASGRVVYVPDVDTVIHCGRIVRDAKGDEGFSGADLTIPHAFVDHVGEQLRDDRGHEGFAEKLGFVAIFVHDVSLRPDF